MEVRSPSGKQRAIAGRANKVGYFRDPEADFIADEPGRWTVDVRVWHDGLTSAGPAQTSFPDGSVLGSRDGSFSFYVVEREAPSLALGVSAVDRDGTMLQRRVSPESALAARVRPAAGPIDFEIEPTSPDLSDLDLCVTAVMPGFILDQHCGESLLYRYDAASLQRDFPNLDLFDQDGVAGADTVTFSFLLSGIETTGQRRHFARSVVLQGEHLIAPSQQPNPCDIGPETLCLSRGRFEVEVEWRDFQGRSGRGRASPLTSDTGTFWFFDPANVELVIKVLDARAFNGHFWVFYGALSNVEYAITVTDTETGAVRNFTNPPGRFASIGDAEAFPVLGSASSRSTSLPLPPPPAGHPGMPRESATSCSPTGLCLADGRFRVEVVWRDFQGGSGVGTAVPLTSDTGTFWFFDPANVELVVKVLDARAINSHFWVFYGALSNVEYTITVTDTETGAVRSYTNPSGRFASLGDTEAF